VRSQLPLITQRLQLALDKLQAPSTEDEKPQRASIWWHAFADRSAGQDIQLSSSLTDDPPIPAGLFDSVVENLLENARYKRQREPGITINVSLVTDARGATLTVTDSGSPVPQALRQALFSGAVRSASGLGIGLHQAARYAQQHGYRLRLLDRVEDGVAFELSLAGGTPGTADAVRDLPAAAAQGS
jgi:signal transduction histidine kinase